METAAMGPVPSASLAAGKGLRSKDAGVIALGRLMVSQFSLADLRTPGLMNYRPDCARLSPSASVRMINVVSFMLYFNHLANKLLKVSGR